MCIPNTDDLKTRYHISDVRNTVFQNESNFEQWTEKKERQDPYKDFYFDCDPMVKNIDVLETVGTGDGSAFKKKKGYPTGCAMRPIQGCSIGFSGRAPGRSLSCRICE